MNSVGQIFHTADAQNETTYQMNTAQYPSGIYFLSVKNYFHFLIKRIPRCLRRVQMSKDFIAPAFKLGIKLSKKRALAIHY